VGRLFWRKNGAVIFRVEERDGRVLIFCLKAGCFERLVTFYWTTYYHIPAFRYLYCVGIPIQIIFLPVLFVN
jgi:hypothetical protein